MPKYMRKRISGAEESFSPLLEDGMDAYRRAFSDTGAVRPQLAITLFLFLFFFSGQVSAYSLDLTRLEGPTLLLLTIGFLLPAIAVSSIIWAMFVALRGLYRVGGLRLRLSPFYTDRLLGLRPVGALALQSVAPFFGLLVAFTIAGLSTAGTVTIITAMFPIGMTAVGLLMFFLPLTRSHRLMLERKRSERQALATKLRGIFDRTADQGLAPQSDIMKAELLDRKVAAMGTWPFDTSIIGRLIAILLSVTAILLSSYLKSIIPGLR
ncbi:MAG: hypothetical protein HY247_00025 [archaeon]|nr:MAG: hypothetical protein HY247_00025 [archaeon]